MFCPHSVFMCFVWISEQTAIISLYNINWLVFISVYWAVRTECLYIIQVNLKCSSFLGTYGKLCKSTNSYVIPLHLSSGPSVREEQLDSHSTDFH